MWLGPNNEFPYDRRAMRKDFPHVSLPANLTAKALAPLGIHPAWEATPPSYDPDTQVVEPGDFVAVDGGFERQWVVRDLTEQELADRLQARREAMVVPRLSARLALIGAGLWDTIQPAIDAIADDTERAVAQAYFDDARNWERLDPWVASIGAAMGLSEAELDALFEAAANV